MHMFSNIIVFMGMLKKDEIVMAMHILTEILTGWVSGPKSIIKTNVYYID